jgi:hypothetical protein
MVINISFDKTQVNMILKIFLARMCLNFFYYYFDKFLACIFITSIFFSSPGQGPSELLSRRFLEIDQPETRYDYGDHAC